MKKLISIIMAFVFMALLTACSGTTDKPVPTAEPTQSAQTPTAEPTEAPTEVPTEAPTEVPTEEPTAEPTEAPTPEPTEVPEPVSLAFSDCAKEVCRLPWYNGNWQNLDTSGVYFETDDEGMSPNHFYVDGDLIYIYDQWLYSSNSSMLVYNMKTGEKTRITGVKVSHLTDFAVLDGKIYSPNYIYDIETGEYEKLNPVYNSSSDTMESTYLLTARGGKVYMYASEPNQPAHDFIGADWLDEYELDLEFKAWVPIRRMAEKTDDGQMTLWDGSTVGFGYWLGEDNEGCHYVFVSEAAGVGLVRRITKYAPDGTPLASTELPFDGANELMGVFAESSCIRIGTDGKLYMFVSYIDSFVVYMVEL